MGVRLFVANISLCAVDCLLKFDRQGNHDFEDKKYYEVEYASRCCYRTWNGIAACMRC